MLLFLSFLHKKRNGFESGQKSTKLRSQKVKIGYICGYVIANLYIFITINFCSDTLIQSLSIKVSGT